MDLGISGKTALITGGDSGIGLATARLLLEEGVRVCITDVPSDDLDAAVAGLPGEVQTVSADLTSGQDVERLVREVEAGIGMPDILVNTAGITGPQGDFHEIDIEGWQECIDIDLIAAVRVCKAFLNPMRERGWGRIVLISSEDAIQPYADEIPYCAAKAAVLALMKGLSKGYGSEGVLVNAVSPAFIETPMTDAMMTRKAKMEGTDEETAIKDFLAKERPGMELGRRGRAEEVASVITFLCSERASFVNGSNYRVDSGSVGTIN